MKNKATDYCIRFGHSLWSARTNCQRKGLKTTPGEEEIYKTVKVKQFIA